MEPTFTKKEKLLSIISLIVATIMMLIVKVL